MTPRRTIVFDSLLLFAVTVLAVVAAWVLISTSPPRWVLLTALAGLTLIAMGSVIARWVSRPDHLKAMHSDQMLQIANESLSYLRKGLNTETAGEVCRLALHKTEAAAVAITDTEAILGFAGLGEDHHHCGRSDSDAGTRRRSSSTSTEYSKARQTSDAPSATACCELRSSCLSRCAVALWERSSSTTPPRAF
jgi:LytS/YehU family sensor histidine kinase